jgi:hypothetical protein
MTEQSNAQNDGGNIVAIDEAMERWHAEADEEERQYGLFAEPQTEAGRAKALTYRRGPGRPPGARNRRTERSAAFLLSRHRDPREILLEIAEANVADLAGLLNSRCSRQCRKSGWRRSACCHTSPAASRSSSMSPSAPWCT